MSRQRCFRAPWPLLFVVAALIQPLAAADVPSVPKLVPGVELPAVEARTLSGDTAALPRDANGHAAVLVIGFSKAAGKISQPWLESCRTAAAAGLAGSGVDCYDVRMLEGIPRSFRGMAERGMRSGFPAELQHRTLLVYQENQSWRERLGATDETTAYVIGCDREGRVRGTAAGPFVEAELKKILGAIESTPPNGEPGR